VTRGYDSVMTDGAGPRDQAALVRALLAARQAGDAELITSAAISLPLGQRFGAHPGQVPALLYEAYAQATAAPRRCRLAAALARAWVYGGHPERPRVFARDWADEARVTRLGLEREALLREVGAATGLAGRRRRFGSADERARVAVRKAISAALARVAQQDAALARLFRDTVRTGTVCRYDPDPARPVTWILDGS